MQNMYVRVTTLNLLHPICRNTHHLLCITLNGRPLFLFPVHSLLRTVQGSLCAAQAKKESR